MILSIKRFKKMDLILNYIQWKEIIVIFISGAKIFSIEGLSL